MANTSASGGPLLPLTDPPYGAELLKIVQNWMVPLIGLPGNMVVVYDQPEPPNIPDAGDAFAAVRVTLTDADTFPAVIHDSAGLGSDTLVRNEILECLASFYDLGSTGLAQRYAARFRDGTAIAQNREPLYMQSMALRSVGSLTGIPSLFKMRWQYRVDVPFRLAREVRRVYAIENLEVADILLKANVEGPPELIERLIEVPPP